LLLQTGHINIIRPFTSPPANIISANLRKSPIQQAELPAEYSRFRNLKSTIDGAKRALAVSISFFQLIVLVPNAARSQRMFSFQ
jgi:hypothetical protein